jgi:hypothetical protein
MYRTFTRTWWRIENGKRVPGTGRRSYAGHDRFETEDEARAYCRRWNETHAPGLLSRKAEYEEV